VKSAELCSCLAKRRLANASLSLPRILGPRVPDRLPLEVGNLIGSAARRRDNVRLSNNQGKDRSSDQSKDTDAPVGVHGLPHVIDALLPKRTGGGAGGCDGNTLIVELATLKLPQCSCLINFRKSADAGGRVSGRAGAMAVVGRKKKQRRQLGELREEPSLICT